jgi:hypothetical protein
MYDLYKMLRRVLEEDEGVFIDKDDWVANEVKRFKSFRFNKSKGDFTRVETKSSLGLNFW